MGCGEKSHRLCACSVFASSEDQEYIAEIAAKYAATLLGAELVHFSTSFSVHGCLDFAKERWRGKRVTFQSVLAFARSSSKRHPADVGHAYVGGASNSNVRPARENPKPATVIQQRDAANVQIHNHTRHVSIRPPTAQPSSATFSSVPLQQPESSERQVDSGSSSYSVSHSQWQKA